MLHVFDLMRLASDLPNYYGTTSTHSISATSSYANHPHAGIFPAFYVFLCPLSLVVWQQSSALQRLATIICGIHPKKHQARERADTCSTFVPIPLSSIVVFWLPESMLMQYLPDIPPTSTVYGGLSPRLSNISTLPRIAPTVPVTCIRGILTVTTHLGRPRFQSGSLQLELVSASQSRRLIPIWSSIVTAVTAIGIP